MGKLSIQKKLPLLICLLVFAVIISFSLISYLGVKKASVKAAEMRLHSITEQLSNLFGQNSQNYLAVSRKTAGNDTIAEFLISGGMKFYDESKEILDQISTDSLVFLSEILDADAKPVMYRGKKPSLTKIDLAGLIKESNVIPDSSRIGKIMLFEDSLYYPVIGPVSENKKLIGYTIRWRVMRATEKAIEQFSKLLGSDAKLYLGNADGTGWTDLRRPVKDPHESGLITSSGVIPHSPWQVMIGFPQKTVLQGANKFLKTTLIMGAILLLLAFAAAWVMSRNITSPIKKLELASAAIEKGDYDTKAEISGRDELGKLARAFNSMVRQVRSSKENLERTVNERTEQLRTSNNELEAFSYSVSHDLRAPLRSINGYAIILKEDYGTKLDNEAQRLTNKIISNAAMMGQLIDSLIAFSQMGSKELVHQTIDMHKLVEDCLQELIPEEKRQAIDVRIGHLPSCNGDVLLVRQVVTNLLSNAIKYSSKTAKPKIEIGCNEGKDVNTYFVKDNGAGFDMKYAHKLFGVFQRLHHAKDYEGTGIGLAFSKRIIAKHKGEIWGEAVPGEGASFYFSLPVNEKNIIEKTVMVETDSTLRRNDQESVDQLMR